MRIEGLLNSSYVRLWYTNPDLDQENKYIIGTDPERPVKSRIETLGGGIKDFTVKVEGQNIIVSTVFVVPFQTLNLSQDPDLNNEIENLFNLNNTWGAQLGRGEKNDFCWIPNLRVGESQIEYSTSIRGIEISLTLHGALFSLLNYIKLSNLKKYDIQYGRNSFSEDNLIDPSLGFITLRNVVTAILNSCKRYIALSSAERLAINDPTFVPPPIIETPDLPFFQNENVPLPPGVELPPAPPINSENLPADQLEKLRVYEEEDAILGATPDLIPSFSDLRKIIVAKTPEEGLEVYNKSWNGKLIKTNNLKKLYEELSANDRTSVQAYLSALLNEKALQMVPAPQISVKRSGLSILVIPIGAIQGAGFSEFEVKEDGQISDKYNSSDYSDEYFNLQKVGNVVLSVQASTNKGEQTLASISQAKRLAENDAADQELSIYNFLEKTSKEITVEMIGAPKLTYYDNVNIEFLSSVFTGNYKIISFTHKVNGNQFTTEFEAIRLEKGISSSANNAAADEISKEKRKKEFEEGLNFFERMFGKLDTSEINIIPEGQTMTEAAEQLRNETGSGLPYNRWRRDSN